MVNPLRKPSSLEYKIKQGVYITGGKQRITAKVALSNHIRAARQRKSKLQISLWLSYSWLLTIQKAILKRWGKTFTGLQQCLGNLRMKTATSAQCSWRCFLRNRNYLQQTTQQWEMKRHVPFVLRTLRTPSESDVYFDNKAWRRNSAKCLQIHRSRITFLMFCFSIPFSE